MINVRAPHRAENFNCVARCPRLIVRRSHPTARMQRRFDGGMSAGCTCAEKTAGSRIRRSNKPRARGDARFRGQRSEEESDDT
jgi:hypothetical protein